MNSEMKNTPETDLNELFRKYSGMVFRICLRYTRNREDAEDMVSEVFLKVNASLHKYRGESKPMVWIYRIAVNQCLDLLRSKRSRKEFDAGDLDFLRGAPVQGGHGDQCLARITLDRILEKINPITRKSLFLHYVEGLPHHEVAQVLGPTREAVTKRLNRFAEDIQRQQKENEAVATSRTPRKETWDLSGAMPPSFLKQTA